MYCIDIMDIEKAKKFYMSQIEADQILDLFEMLLKLTNIKTRCL